MVVTASSAIPRSTVFPLPVKVASVLTFPPVPLAMSFATVQAPRPALRVSSHLITCPSAAPFWFRSSRVIVLFTILLLSIVLFSMLNCPILFIVTSPPTSTGVGSLAALPTKINPSSKLRFPSGISTNPPSVKEIRFPTIDNCCSSVSTVPGGRSTKPPSVSEIRFPAIDNCCSSVLSKYLFKLTLFPPVIAKVFPVSVRV